MDIGTKIKKIREMKNLSREHIAEALKMSTRGYSKIESNESKPGLDKLEEISKALDIDIIDLLSFDDKQVFNNVFHNASNGNNGNIVINENVNFEKERALYEQVITGKEEQIKLLQKELEQIRKSFK
ncbi:MAG: helix-turn-helix transcriptional regulator [Bacteroidetes bacterium]|nr:helix-turn-helix transcriptional regulator [Bacteroidota bacterium]